MNRVLSVDYRFLRIINGTQHPINYYSDEVSSVRQKRRNSNDYILAHSDVKEKISFETDYILSANSRHNIGVNFGELPLAMPKLRDIPKIHDSILTSDVIIVSREYASAYRDNAWTDAEFDLMDRFYIDGTKVFGYNKNGVWGPIGTTYLEKFALPNGGKNVYAYPHYGDNRYGFREMNSYIEAYDQGRSPSLASVILLLNYLPTVYPSIENNYTYTTLYYHAMNDIQGRQRTPHAEMPTIYNV